MRSRPLEDILREVKHFLKKGAKKIAIMEVSGFFMEVTNSKNVDEEAFVELLQGISNLTGPKNLTIQILEWI